MEEFFVTHNRELLWTGVTIMSLFILRFIVTRATKRIGKKGNFAEARSVLVTKYITFILAFLAVGAIIFIWGINIKDLGLLFSSVFAIIGVALFAQWSILSNLTSGVILFFSFPFKIGDRVKIMDKEIVEDEEIGYDVFIIEDIKTYHLYLRNSKGDLLTYPNNMMLQKAVTLVNASDG